MLAPEKCHVIHLGKKNPKHTYYLQNNEITIVESVRDLGIQINCNLLSKENVHIRANKATKALFQLLRILKVNDPGILTHCFKTYVLPLLEFASPVWSPYLKGDIEKLEKVQRLFTKIVYHRNKLTLCSYQERCKYLGLSPLYKRRIMSDLVTAFKIVKGETKLLKCSKFFEHRQGYTRSTSLARFNIRKTKTEFRRQSFSLRCSRWLNKLPPSILQVPNSKIFKQKLTELDLDF